MGRFHFRVWRIDYASEVLLPLYLRLNARTSAVFWDESAAASQVQDDALVSGSQIGLRLYQTDHASDVLPRLLPPCDATTFAVFEDELGSFFASKRMRSWVGEI